MLPWIIAILLVWFFVGVSIFLMHPKKSVQVVKAPFKNKNNFTFYMICGPIAWLFTVNTWLEKRFENIGNWLHKRFPLEEE